MRAITLVACLAALFEGTACSNREGLHAGAATDSMSIISIGDRSTCSNCISLSHVVTLGDSVGNGALDENSWVGRDSAGRYWIGQKSGLKVFDVNAKLLSAINGPAGTLARLTTPRPLYANGKGAMYLFDATGNIMVVDTSFAVLKTFATPGYLRSAVMLDDSTYVANAWVKTEENIGEPLHIIRGSSVVKSFGRMAVDSDMVVAAGPSLERVLARGDSGRIFSAKSLSYEIASWDTAGRRYATYVGPTLNKNQANTGSYSKEKPPRAQIAAIAALDSRHLMLLVVHPREDWSSRLASDSARALQPEEPFREGTRPNDVFSTRIEILDIETQEIVARTEIPRLIFGFVGSDHVFERDYYGDGSPRVVIHRVHVSPFPRR
jgi:hypothetical protein